MACYVASIGRILSPVDKGCSGMISGRKLACTEAAKELSGTPRRGSHAVAWLGASSDTPGHGSHVVTWLGSSSGTLYHGSPLYSVAPAQCNPPTSDDHNFFVRTPFWVLLDSIESPLSLKSIHI